MYVLLFYVSRIRKQVTPFECHINLCRRNIITSKIFMKVHVYLQSTHKIASVVMTDIYCVWQEIPTRFLLSWTHMLIMHILLYLLHNSIKLQPKTISKLIISQ